jgi:hypothetical protein
LDKYRDNNNFLRKNYVEYSYARYFVWVAYKFTTFLDIFTNAPYIVGPSFPVYYLSRDGGKTYEVEQVQRLYGTWFFLYHSVNEYSYEPQNFVGVISKIGGFTESVFVVFSIMLFIINSRVAERKLIRNLYFVEKEPQSISVRGRTMQRIDSLK